MTRAAAAVKHIAGDVSVLLLITDITLYRCNQRENKSYIKLACLIVKHALPSVGIHPMKEIK